jgi:pimeloyl-ACP methyl ester carboxylesterase
LSDLLSLFPPDLLARIDDLSAKIQTKTEHPPGPRVIVVPGLPGSLLGYRIGGVDVPIWFALDTARKGRLFEAAYDYPGAGLEPLGILEPAYLQIILRLRLLGFDVAAHPYDWRRPVRDLGSELADRIRSEGRPVHLVAHSFGGLVARAALLSGAPGVGEVVLLGPTNRGCFEVVEGIRGTHGALRVLSALDGHHSAWDLGRLFSGWPSVYEALPERVCEEDLDLFDPGAWPAEGIQPRPDLLAAAAATKAWLAGSTGRFHVIAGYGVPTIQRVEVRDGLIHYLRSNDGDGFVTTGRAPLVGHPCYWVRASHVGMPNHEEVIPAVEDILSTGSTDRLPDSPPDSAPLSVFCAADVHEPPFQGRSGDDLTPDDIRQALDELAGSFSGLPIP